MVSPTDDPALANMAMAHIKVDLMKELSKALKHAYVKHPGELCAVPERANVLEVRKRAEYIVKTCDHALKLLGGDMAPKIHLRDNLHGIGPAACGASEKYPEGRLTDWPQYVTCGRCKQSIVFRRQAQKHGPS